VEILLTSGEALPKRSRIVAPPVMAKKVERNAIKIRTNTSFHLGTVKKMAVKRVIWNITGKIIKKTKAGTPIIYADEQVRKVMARARNRLTGRNNIHRIIPGRFSYVCNSLFSINKIMVF